MHVTRTTDRMTGHGCTAVRIAGQLSPEDIGKHLTAVATLLRGTVNAPQLSLDPRPSEGLGPQSSRPYSPRFTLTVLLSGAETS